MMMMIDDDDDDDDISELLAHRNKTNCSGCSAQVKKIAII
jgi:hypothetical protein